MSARADIRSWMPENSWWAMLACVLAVGLAGNWFLAAGVAVALLIYVARPFDFVVAYTMVAGGSAFIYYAGGNLTLQIGLLSAGIVLMLIFYVLARGREALALPRTMLTLPLMVYLLLSAANTVRGVLVGYAMKDILIELLPVLGLGSALLVGNLFDAKRDMRLVVAGLVGVSFASAALGYRVFAIIRTHTAGIYFHPLPGVVALLLFNLALRSRRLTTAFLWIALSLPLLLHQFLSFRRGLWLGLMAGLVTSILIFAGRRGSGARWKRTGALLGGIIGAGVLGAFGLAIFYGQTDILDQAAGRFASIGSTEVSRETMSNVTRLIEYSTAAGHIQQSPWVGHGLGYKFLVRNFISGKTDSQWWVHQNYILMWLKQGLIGLLIFLWMLVTAIRLGAHHARRREDPWESAWLAGTSAATAFMAAFSLSDYPFDLVEAMFQLALFWGAAMAMAREGFLSLHWSGPHGPNATVGAKDSQALPAGPAL